MKKRAIIFFVFCTCALGAQSFVHPGILHSEASLERIRSLVEIKSQPAYGSYQILVGLPEAQADYIMKGPFEIVSRDGEYRHTKDPSERDFNAAYYNAILWVITRKQAHADKTMEIIRAYARTIRQIPPTNDAPLCAGLQGFMLINAAEIMRYTYIAGDYQNGWSTQDTKQVEDMLRNVFQPVLTKFFSAKPYTNGNWGAMAIKAQMSFGIFMNDRKMYDDAVNFFHNGDDNGSLPNYIAESGQSQEAGRDQQHAMLGVSCLADAAEVAWTQGDDLYGALDNRIMKGYEYLAKYNLGYDVPFVTWKDITGKYSNWTTISDKGKGRFRSVFEIAYNHYVVRKGLEMPYSKIVLDSIRSEGPGFTCDNTGFGSLLYYLGTPSRQLVHPGLSHKKSDLERMRIMVQNKKEPWYTTFEEMSKLDVAKHSYEVRGNASIEEIIPGSDNNKRFSSDSQAAYFNALMWAITGDEKHALKCVEIFKAWSGIKHFMGGGTQALDVGREIWHIVEGAEIIQSTYKGWKEEDKQKFKDMLVYPEYSRKSIPASVSNTLGGPYWRLYMGDSFRHGNQDLFGWRGVMAIGVFLDNDTIYKRALRYFKGEDHLPYDLPYQSGPPDYKFVNSNEYYDTYQQTGYRDDIQDYGYNGVLKNYIWETGQSQESSRDQDHAMLGVGMVASLAEIAWNQGEDIYSLYDNRILKGYEWAIKYNLTWDFQYPDQPVPWEPGVEDGTFVQRHDRSGRWYSKKVGPYKENNFSESARSRGSGAYRWDKRPVYELAYNHYIGREGFVADSLTWIIRAMDVNKRFYGKVENKTWSMDHLGWGGLTVRRADFCPGDPCVFVNKNPVFGIHNIPGVIEAEDYDHFSGKAQGRTYFELSGTDKANNYRPESAVTLLPHEDNGYKVSDMEDGEWLVYTIHIPETSLYTIKVNYSATQSGGKMKIGMNGGDKFSFADMPQTEPDVFADIILAREVILEAGVSDLRIYVGGKSNVLELNSLSVIKE